MKNLIMAIVMIGTVFEANAACVGGEEITGKDGHVFCLSEEKMNWWSAFQWCSAQGRHLATPDEACNYGKIHWGGGTCGNINNGLPYETGKQLAWLSLSRNKTNAFGLDIADGGIHNWVHYQKHSACCYALCY